jgi:hypothetical protein
MWVEVRNNQKHLMVGVTYRQQHGRYAPDYWPKLQSCYDKAVATRIQNIILLGDLNADPGTGRVASLELNEFLATNNLHQHINEPTRIANGVRSILDLIITNLPMLVSDLGVDSPVHENDHRTIYAKVNMKTQKRGAFKRNMWEFKRANFEDYRTELSGTNWDPCLETDDINITCDKWTEMFLEISRR